MIIITNIELPTCKLVVPGKEILFIYFQGSEKKKKRLLLLLFLIYKKFKYFFHWKNEKSHLFEIFTSIFECRSVAKSVLSSVIFIILS